MLCETFIFTSARYRFKRNVKHQTPGIMLRTLGRTCRNGICESHNIVNFLPTAAGLNVCAARTLCVRTPAKRSRIRRRALNVRSRSILGSTTGKFVSIPGRQLTRFLFRALIVDSEDSGQCVTFLWPSRRDRNS